MKHLFIVNPAAGNKNKEALKRGIQNLNLSDAEVRYTAKKGDATTFAAETDGLIYAVGGDGTVREVAEGAVAGERLMCVLPAGSGNDFVRSIYPKKFTLSKVLAALPTMEECRIDCGKTSHGVFANIASVGFDAEVVRHSKKIQKIPFLKHISYILSIFYTILFYRGMSMHVNIDGHEITEDILLMAIANGQYYGGGVRIAPDAILDDGYFDVYWIEKVSRLHFLALVPSLLNGSHVRLRQVRHFRAKQVSFRSESEFLFNLDGELMTATEADIQILPGGLRILRPKEGTV